MLEGLDMRNTNLGMDGQEGSKKTKINNLWRIYSEISVFSCATLWVPVMASDIPLGRMRDKAYAGF